MNRAKKSPEWKEFIQTSIGKEFEVITRIGDPVFLHRQDTPVSVNTVWVVFFAKKNGKWSKNQLRGMELFKQLGLHIFKYGELK